MTAFPLFAFARHAEILATKAQFRAVDVRCHPLKFKDSIVGNNEQQKKEELYLQCEKG